MELTEEPSIPPVNTAPRGGEMELTEEPSIPPVNTAPRGGGMELIAEPSIPPVNTVPRGVCDQMENLGGKKLGFEISAKIVSILPKRRPP